MTAPPFHGRVPPRLRMLVSTVVMPASVRISSMRAGTSRSCPGAGNALVAVSSHQSSSSGWRELHRRQGLSPQGQEFSSTGCHNRDIETWPPDT
jgi:hypothetical protein